MVRGLIFNFKTFVEKASYRTMAVELKPIEVLSCYSYASDTSERHRIIELNLRTFLVMLLSSPVRELLPRQPTVQAHGRDLGKADPVPDILLAGTGSNPNEFSLVFLGRGGFSSEFLF